MRTYWLNYPVCGYGYWTKQEKEIVLNNKTVIALPLTQEKQASLHIELVEQRISAHDAVALFNKFLSHLCWVSHQPYWMGEDGWSAGNSSKPQHFFDREQRIPFDDRSLNSFPDDFELLTDDIHLKAIALFREAYVAQRYSTAYACLSYYKVLEIEKKKHNYDHRPLNEWLEKQIHQMNLDRDFRIKTLQDMADKKGKSLTDFLYTIRNEAAHYMNDSDINLDNVVSYETFGNAVVLFHNLAENYIHEILQVPSYIYDISYDNNSIYAFEKNTNT